MSWSHHIPEPQIPLKKHSFCTFITHQRPKNRHFLLKSGFCEMAKRAKLAYFDGNLLNRKMVVAKTLLKSGFLLILMLLKSGFHCTMKNDVGCEAGKIFHIHIFT